MATAETKKTRETIFNRAYRTMPDGSIVAEISHEDAVIVTLELSKVGQVTKDKSAIRYLCDGVVGTGHGAMKAEGGTLESAIEKMEAMAESAYADEWKFRAAQGEATLSTEEEHNVIAAELLVIRPKAFADVAAALAWVQGVYSKVKPQVRKAKDGTEKTVETRPEYNKLKNVAQIRAAIARALPAGTESDLDALGIPTVA